MKNRINNVFHNMWFCVRTFEMVQYEPGQRVKVKFLHLNGKNEIFLSLKNISQVSKDISELQVGSIIEGSVKNIHGWGIFVKFGSIEGLVHVSKISEFFGFYIKHPSEKVKGGDNLKCKITGIDKKRVDLEIVEILSKTKKFESRF